MQNATIFADIAPMSTFGRVIAAGVIVVAAATTPGCARGEDRISTRSAAA